MTCSVSKPFVLSNRRNRCVLQNILIQVKSYQKLNFQVSMSKFEVSLKNKQTGYLTLLVEVFVNRVMAVFIKEGRACDGLCDW